MAWPNGARTATRSRDCGPRRTSRFTHRAAPQGCRIHYGLLAAPPSQYFADREMLAERIASTASGLLGLLGIKADPLRSREHILISNILEQAWTASKVHPRNPDPVDTVASGAAHRRLDLGVFLDPSAQRLELDDDAQQTLSPLRDSAPGCRGNRSMWPDATTRRERRPRMSIFSIAHLSDAESGCVS